MSPTFVILLSPKLTLSPKVLFVNVSVVAFPTKVSVATGNVKVMFAPPTLPCAGACIAA